MAEQPKMNARVVNWLSEYQAGLFEKILSFFKCFRDVESNFGERVLFFCCEGSIFIGAKSQWWNLTEGIWLLSKVGYLSVDLDRFIGERMECLWPNRWLYKVFLLLVFSIYGNLVGNRLLPVLVVTIQLSFLVGREGGQVAINGDNPSSNPLHGSSAMVTNLFNFN